MFVQWNIDRFQFQFSQQFFGNIADVPAPKKGIVLFSSIVVVMPGNIQWCCDNSFDLAGIIYVRYVWVQIDIR